MAFDTKMASIITITWIIAGIYGSFMTATSFSQIGLPLLSGAFVFIVSGYGFGTMKQPKKA